MELRLPTPEEYRAACRDYREAFPLAERKSAWTMRRLWEAGKYLPYCFFDGQDLLGGAFLWVGRPGWRLLDYLFVTAQRRNQQLGGEILRALRELEGPDTVIFGEVEVPAAAPDPAMAQRRMGFYARNGWRWAGYETRLYGVRFQTLYLAGEAVADQALIAEHQYIYQHAVGKWSYARNIRIPYDPAAGRRGTAREKGSTAYEDPGL
jgi:GNAT superfamily N-acetyltransferase